MATHSNGEQFSKHTDELKSKAADLGRDAKDFGVITGSLAADAARLAEERVAGYYQEGVKKAKVLGASLEGRIRENPVRSLVIATGVGLLLGKLLRRR